MSDFLQKFALNGKVAWVTGASYGLGFAYAQAFAEVGAKVVFNDINEELVARGLENYKAAGIEAYGAVCDVTKEDQVQKFVADVAEKVGPIDILVNNAGIADGKGDIQQGIYDIRLLSSIPDIMISQPKDSQEALDLLYTASQTQNPFFIRYPFGIVSKPSEQISHLLPIGSWSQFQIGLDPKCIVITYGQEFDRIVSKAKENQWDMIVINARFFKPVDEKILKQMFLMQLPIYIFEPDAKGSLSALVMQVYTKIMKPVHVLGIENHFVQQGSVRSIRIHEHISVNALFKEIDHEQHAVR